MKQQIKHIDGAVLFECDVPESHSHNAMRYALEKATESGANLGRANLGRANLARADLARANLAGKKLIGSRPIFMIGTIGSRGDYLTSYITDAGLFVQAGCFFGSVDEFEAQVKETHGDNNHGKEYAAAIVMMKAHFDIWNETIVEPRIASNGIHADAQA